VGHEMAGIEEIVSLDIESCLDRKVVYSIGWYPVDPVAPFVSNTVTYFNGIESTADAIAAFEDDDLSSGVVQHACSR
jgi:hypothetical protein